MKYLKIYEDFDWDESDFDFEEDNVDYKIVVIKLNNGTVYSSGGGIPQVYIMRKKVRRGMYDMYDIDTNKEYVFPRGEFIDAMLITIDRVLNNTLKILVYNNDRGLDGEYVFFKDLPTDIKEHIKKRYNVSESVDWDDWDDDEEPIINIDFNSIVNNYKSSKIVKISDEKLKDFNKLVNDNGYKWWDRWFGDKRVYSSSISKYKKKPGKDYYYVKLIQYNKSIRNATLDEIKNSDNIIEI